MTTPIVTPSVPKPRKSRKRWYILGGFALLLLATPVCFYFVSGWLSDCRMEEIYRELDAEDPHWRWPDVVKENNARAGQENSAVQISKARALFDTRNAMLNQWWNTAKDPYLFPNARLPVEEVQMLRKGFDDLDPAFLVEARKLKDMPHGCLGIEAVDIPFVDPQLVEFTQQTRAVVSVLQLDSYLRCQELDYDGAVESCMAALNTARSLKDQPSLIALLVRVAEQSIAVGTIEHTLAQGEFSEAHLQKLQSLLELEIAGDGMHQALRGERASLHQAYLLLREGKMSFSEITGGTRLGAPPSVQDRLIDCFPGMILRGYPEHLRTMNEQVRASTFKDAERVDAMEAIDAKVKKNPTILSSLMMGGILKVTHASQRTQAWLRCTAAGVAAERYRIQHQRWPNTLDDLVQAGLLKEIPKDPYDGQPLRLTRTPTGLIIYSVGKDLVDNGGKLDRANPLAPNIDIGFELWDDFPARRLRGVAPPADEEGK